MTDTLDVSAAPPPQGSVAFPEGRGNARAMSPSSTLAKKSVLPTITTAVAGISDYAAIADLRLSVFSPFSDLSRQRHRVRAREKMIERRMKGATCILARTDDGESDFTPCVRRVGDAAVGAVGTMAGLSGDPVTAAEAHFPAMRWARGADEGGGFVPYRNNIVGTLECSTHEFDGAPFRGYEGESFYVTEVAVAPYMRRQGVALKMIRAAEQLAVDRGMRMLYLHVDAHNEAAIRLYLRAGFQRVEETIETFNFASALGLLSGSFANAEHMLLAKKVDHLAPSASGGESQHAGAAPNSLVKAFLLEARSFMAL